MLYVSAKYVLQMFVKAAKAHDRPMPVCVCLTASNSRPNKSRFRHRITNSRKIFLNAVRLALLKSAMVLKSGFKLRNSQMTSMLRRQSASSRLLDRTRLG